MCIRPSDVVRNALQNVFKILACVLEVLDGTLGDSWGF